MVVNKRKKKTRLRGSRTHKWGSPKKHRGAGNRGGRGLAGTGKRADTKAPSFWKEKKYFGKQGFVRKPLRKKDKTINIKELELNIDKLGEKEGETYKVNLRKKGYQKLLGGGKATKKYEIVVEGASAQARKKIEEKNGKVITPYNSLIEAKKKSQEQNQKESQATKKKSEENKSK